MAEYKGVVRAARTDGAANVYTVDPLPFQVRTLDPTLSGHLLLASELSPSTGPPADEADSQVGFSVHADRVQSYWELPETELRSEVDQRTKFVNSALGPLPMPREFPDAETVRARVMDVEPAYVHKQYTPRKVYHGICLRKTRVRRNPSLPAFQEFASYLTDVYRYSRFENNAEVRDLAKQGAELYFRCLYGNYRPTETTEWRPFEIEIVENDLSKTDMQVLNIVEFQPTKNSELANEWGFDESSQVSKHIQNDLDRFATRNSDKFICATETARRRVCKLVDEGAIEVTKVPPVVPTSAKTPIEEPEHQSSDSNRGTMSAGTKWPSQQTESEDDGNTNDEGKPGKNARSEDGPSRLELLSDLIKLDSDLGHVPDKSDVMRRGAYDVSDYEREFGSLNRGLEEAKVSD